MKPPKKLTACAVAGIIILAATASLAGWQNTHWGMPKAEVMTIAGPSARVSATDCNGFQADAGDTAFYIAADHTMDGFAFEACLAGGEKAGLRAVTLELQNPSAESSARLSAALRARYGTPAEESNKPVGDTLLGIASWFEGDTHIGLLQLSNPRGITATVIYKLRRNGSAGP